MLLLASACSSDGPKILTPEERAAAVPAHGEEWNKIGYRVQWRGFAAMTPGARVASFNPLGDVLAVQDSSSAITVLEAGSGQRRWSDQVGSPLIRFYGAERIDNRLVVSSEAEVFFFDIQTGNLTDKHDLADVVTTPPVVAGDTLVYGTTSNVVLGHSLISGYRAWGILSNAPVATPPIAIGGSGTVGVISRSGEVILLNALNGSTIGRGRMFDGSNAPLAASPSALYVASRDQSLYAFSAEGLEIWRIRTSSPLRNAPAYHDGRVYCDLGSDGLSGVDANNGKILWSNAGVRGTVVAIVKNRLVCFDGSSVALIDPRDGAVVERVAVDGVQMLVPDNFVDGNLYTVASNGVIGKLVPKP